MNCKFNRFRPKPLEKLRHRNLKLLFLLGLDISLHKITFIFFVIMKRMQYGDDFNKFMYFKKVLDPTFAFECFTI